MAIVKGAADVGPASDQTLGYGSTTAVIVREVGSEVFDLDPSANPFVLLTDRAGSEGSDNPKFEWYERALRPKATQINNGAGYTAGDTVFTVDDGNVFRVDDVVRVPRIDELMLVTAQTSTTVTATRAQGGTSAAALVDNDDLFVVGRAAAENANVGTPDEWQSVHKYNLTQIFRTEFGASRTRTRTKTYTGETRAELRAESGKMHAIDMERAYIFGGRQEAGSGPSTLRRMTGGFLFFATENPLNMAGVPLSEPDLEGWLEDVFAHTAAGDSRTVFAGAPVISAFDMLGIDKIRIEPSTSTYGLAISQYKTSHGILNIVKHRLLEDFTGGQGYGDWGLAVNLQSLKDRTIDTTKLLVDRQGRGRDGWIDEYLTESGLQVKNPELQGVLKNVGAFA